MLSNLKGEGPLLFVISRKVSKEVQSKKFFLQFPIVKAGPIENLIRFSFGPALTIGNYRQNFFDYTSLETFLEITNKSGSSPFQFDNINDDLKLNLNFNQQIIKSLSLGVSTYLNIDNDSDKFNQFINTKYSLNWNRRAYNFQFYFEQDTKNAGLNFTIFGPPFKGLGKQF